MTSGTGSNYSEPGSKESATGGKEIELRSMTTEDIPFAMRLKSIANWNQIVSDWEFLLEAGAGGNFVALIDGEKAGTVTTITYQDRFSWIGMVLVDPDFRRRGVGTALLETAISCAREKGTVRLDATPEGEKLYETMGFLSERELVRFERAALPAPPGDPGVTWPVTAGDMEEIKTIDRDVFGADRSVTLEYLFRNSPHYACCVKRESRISAYCFGRTGSRYEQIGPIVADNREDARRLLATALVSCEDREVVMDVFTANSDWVDVLKSMDFKAQRRLIRMNLGKLENPGIPGRQYAIAAPEFG